MASPDDLAALPTPEMITLLFKCHKSTTALSVLPTTPFAEIKSLLLGALQSRNIRTFPNSDNPLPEDPEELDLGVLTDKKDAAKGWVPVNIRERELAGGKGIKRKSGGKDLVLDDSPLGAGLSDGAWVAYRMRPERKQPEAQDEDDEMEGTPGVEIPDDPGFDVVIPSFEDEAE